MSVSNSTVKWLKLPAAGLAALAMAGAPATAQEDKITISLIQILTVQEWASELADGARAAVADIGEDKVELRVQGPAGFELAKQAQVALNEVERGTDAVILSNVAPGAMIEPAAILADRGVPVTWVVSAPPDEVENAFYVGANAYATGEAGVNLILDALEAQHGVPAAELSGEVVQGLCVPGLPVLTQRIAAIEATLAERVPNATVLRPFDSKLDLTQSYAAWNQAIQKYPNALFYSDPCEDANKNIQKIRMDDGIDVPQVYYDNPEIAREALKDGEVTAIVSSNRFTEGYVAVWATVRALMNEGEDFPVGWIEVPHKVIDQSNVESYIAAWNEDGTNLREFFDEEILAVRDTPLDTLRPASDYNRPPE
ncbi:sugar ABC transporter substrate-binding protein [Celeribacter indicus]|uniref:Ribose ABC transporter substrate-binding protein n=1 Tax=Celeribacter indicus TaxID=1208324 RepID=A0A0B5DUN9_9RHOB|nr:sugar ABC transporter substrate-binding protein [Celeribacter indicus]AJE44945.1 ribose ABC transporter substrate-binding protein [Celeribacter indicus]SDW96641.1 ribose transport system substrate-binding protein [Celeribacter indicus]